jgi:mono/diheme cytochrome c family protein
VQRLAFAVFVALALATAACSGVPPVATSADAARAQTSLAELSQGRTLLLSRCGGCHRPPMPADHAAREWPVMLDEMSARAGLNPRGRERTLLERYLVAMAPR